MARRPQHGSPPLTADRIRNAAWAQIATHGTAGLSLRGTARQLGVTAPAIYNYYRRLDDLITALIVEAFTALAEAMDAAEKATPSGRCFDHVMAQCLTYRLWAVEHPLHFQLIYGNPIPGYFAPREQAVVLARRPFLGLFRWFARGYEAGELTIPAEYRDTPPRMAASISAWKRESGIEMPNALVALLMSGWARIHGVVMLELFGHIQPLVGEGPDFFGSEVAAFARQMGMTGKG